MVFLSSHKMTSPRPPEREHAPRVWISHHLRHLHTPENLNSIRHIKTTHRSFAKTSYPYFHSAKGELYKKFIQNCRNIRSSFLFHSDLQNHRLFSLIPPRACEPPANATPRPKNKTANRVFEKMTEWAKKTYNSYYNEYMPWIEDKYLAWFGENKSSYTTKGINPLPPSSFSFFLPSALHSTNGSLPKQQSSSNRPKSRATRTSMRSKTASRRASAGS